MELITVSFVFFFQIQDWQEQMVFPEAAFLNCKNIGPNKEKKLSSMLMFVIFVWLVMEQNIILTGKKILETTVSTQFVTFQNT